MFDILEEQLGRHEGLRFQVYDDYDGKPIVKGHTCQGHPTIGIGRNLADPGVDMHEVEMLLERDMKRAHVDAKSVISNFDELSVNRRAVLVNMVFNLGKPRFSKFKKMISAVESGQFAAAASEMLDSRWAVQVKQRAIELSRLMKHG